MPIRPAVNHEAVIDDVVTPFALGRRKVHRPHHQESGRLTLHLRPDLHEHADGDAAKPHRIGQVSERIVHVHAPRRRTLNHGRESGLEFDAVTVKEAERVSAKPAKDLTLRRRAGRGCEENKKPLSNGSRLSCGALKKIHSLIYARRQLQALVRRTEQQHLPGLKQLFRLPPDTTTARTYRTRQEGAASASAAPPAPECWRSRSPRDSG